MVLKIHVRQGLIADLVAMHRACTGTPLPLESYVGELVETLIISRRQTHNPRLAAPRPATSPASTNGHRKPGLTPGQVQRILYLKDAQHPSVAALAKKFSTTQGAIEQILARRDANLASWKIRSSMGRPRKGFLPREPALITRGNQ